MELARENMKIYSCKEKSPYTFTRTIQSDVCIDSSICPGKQEDSSNWYNNILRFQYVVSDINLSKKLSQIFMSNF